jgi:hypothetical protein
MARYHVDNRLTATQQVLATTFKTQVSLTAATATLCRGQIVELAYGADGAPNATDCQIVYDVSAQTAAGTPSSTVIPVKINPADVASRTIAAINYTAEGTITATSSVFSRSLNQRASQQWYANPGSEIVWPATNLAGFAVRALSPTYAANVLIETRHDDF